MVFPEGIVFDAENDQYLTPKVRSIFTFSSTYRDKMASKKEEDFDQRWSKSLSSEVSNTLATAYRQIFALKDDFIQYGAGVL